MGEPREGHGIVYFIRRADGEGPIKIGCSEWPESRLSTLTAWSPYPLAIVATLPGDVKLERRFQGRFAHLWSHSEWFHADADLERTIAEVAAGTFDVASLPAEGFSRHGNTKRAGPKWPPSKRARQRLTLMLQRSGIDAPRDVHAAVEALDELTGQARRDADELIDRFLMVPWVFGRPLPYPWAQEAYKSFCIKHNLTPEKIKSMRRISAAALKRAKAVSPPLDEAA